MKHSFYHMILLVCTLSTTAQITMQWDKTLDNNDHDILSSGIHTNDSGYLMTDSKTNAKAGNADGSYFMFRIISDYDFNDYWVAKLDANGNKQWEITIDTYDIYTELTSHFATDDGGYLLAGRAYNQYSGYYWVVKIDKDGNEAWNEGYGRGYYDYLKDIITTDDGGYLLAGDSDNGSHFDYWIVKIDKDGNSQWNKSYGGSGDDHLSSVSRTADGGYQLTGTLNIKIDAEGNQVYDLEVNSFILINAERDTEIQAIQDRDTIDLSALSSTKLSIEAITEPETVGSVAFHLAGPFIHGHTENYAPYALFGDNNPKGNFAGRLFPPGEYTLTATPYVEKSKNGQAGAPVEIRFTIIHSDEIDDPQVTGFDLYDAVTDKKIMGLTDGTVIHTDELNHEEFTVLIHTVPDFVGSVKVELWGPKSLTRIENAKPYALFRNNSKDLFGEALPAGEYHLKATPYTKANAKGKAGVPLEVNFTIVDRTNSSARLAVYPVPTTGIVNIAHQGTEEAQLLLMNESGHVVLQQFLSRHTTTQQLDLSSFNKGFYFLKIINHDAVEVKRIVLE